MSDVSRNRKEEDYNGFEIIHYTNALLRTEYFYIAKKGERESCFCLSSVKAAKNVIDTHIRYSNEQTKPIYR